MNTATGPSLSLLMVKCQQAEEWEPRRYNWINVNLVKSLSVLEILVSDVRHTQLYLIISLQNNYVITTISIIIHSLVSHYLLHNNNVGTTSMVLILNYSHNKTGKQWSMMWLCLYIYQYTYRVIECFCSFYTSYLNKQDLKKSIVKLSEALWVISH